MKKILVTMTGAMLFLSSCGTYTGSGAYTGATFGSILGSAIGGISGGPRGSDIGTVIGMAGGAMVGAAVGAQADKAEQERYEQYQRNRTWRGNQSGSYTNQSRQYNDGSGFDPTNSGDDRISFGDTPVAAPRDNGYSAVRSSSGQRAIPGYTVDYNPLIQIRNERFVDANENGVIDAGEECRITFEIMNRSSQVVYDVQPVVVDVTNNKHLHISPGIHVESIYPGKGVRYTATLAAGRQLRNGTASIRIAVVQGKNRITSEVKEFQIPTRRR